MFKKPCGEDKKNTEQYKHRTRLMYTFLKIILHARLAVHQDNINQLKELYIQKLLNISKIYKTKIQNTVRLVKIVFQKI